MTDIVTLLVENQPIEVAFYDDNTLEAQEKALEAQAALAGAIVARTASELARDQAADLVDPANIFIDVSLATAEAAVSTGTTFKLVSSSTGVADVRKRTVGGSDLLYQEATKSALAGPLGAGFSGYQRTGTGSVLRTLGQYVSQSPILANEFSTVGQALTAADGFGAHGTVNLVPGASYSLSSGISFDTMRVSVVGQEATIDASGLTNGTSAVTIDSGNDSSILNSWAYKGQLSSMRIFGGIGESIKDIVGVDFDGSDVGGAAQVYSFGLRLANVKTGFQFSNRAYNSCFIHAEVHFADDCVYWPSGGTDNGERNTFISPTFGAATRGFRNEEPSSTIVLIGGSIDYTDQIGKVVGGKAALTDMHLESNGWGAAPGEPYALYASGDGGFIKIAGGFFLNTAPTMTIKDLIYVGTNAKVVIDGAFLHNFTLTPDTTAGAPAPTCFFTGPGQGSISNSHGFEFGALPQRVHSNRSRLADPDFELGTTSELFDPIYITKDTAAIAAPLTGANIVITKVADTPRTGTRSLKVAKTFGPGSEAEFTIIDVPVRPGEKMFAGFQFRTDPATPGANDGERTMTVGIYWASRKTMPVSGLPVDWRVQLIGTENIIASAQYKMWNWLTDLASRTAPDWADRLIVRVNMFSVNELDMRFDALHADGIS